MCINRATPVQQRRMCSRRSRLIVLMLRETRKGKTENTENWSESCADVDEVKRAGFQPRIGRFSGDLKGRFTQNCYSPLCGGRLW